MQLNWPKKEVRSAQNRRLSVSNSAFLQNFPESRQKTTTESQSQWKFQQVVSVYGRRVIIVSILSHFLINWKIYLFSCHVKAIKNGFKESRIVICYLNLKVLTNNVSCLFDSFMEKYDFPLQENAVSCQVIVILAYTIYL